jgi:hypothetical protein
MRKQITTSCLCLTIILTLLYPASGEAAKQPKQTGGLTGSWQCRGPAGESSLVFQSKELLVYNGEEAHYRLVPGAIRVRGDGGPADYKYTLKGNSLNVTFPDGSGIKCTRVQKGKADQPAASTSPSNSQLKGMFCSWSGSSGSGSGYSSSTRVSFDGSGGFRYSSESSFSGSAGQYYGGKPANSGRYRVSGDTVQMTFSDGSTGTAKVNMRQRSGRITEIMYGKKLFAPALCN